MADTDTKEQTVIDEHKKMLIMTGNLSDFQLQNLKTWPFIVFDKELEKTEIKYDFTKLVAEKEELAAGSVTYDFAFKKDTKLDRAETKKKLEMLKLWTQFLFWKDTTVQFTRAGKKWEV
jgi:hypothetical protein